MGVPGTGGSRCAECCPRCRSVPNQRIGWTGTPDFPTMVAIAENAQGATTSAATPIIDAHAHLQARGPHHPQSDFGGAAAKALEGMDREGISRTIVMPPPFSPDSPGKYDLEDFARAMSERASRLSYLGGRRDPQSDASRGRPLGIHQGRSATELRSPSP